MRKNDSREVVEKLMQEWEERDNSLRIRVKKLDEKAVIPEYAHLGDGGMDLTAVSVKKTEDYIEYGTGLAMEIPNGFVGLVFPRSSISKKDLSLANAVGMIDHQYRGEVFLRFKNSFSAETWVSNIPLKEYEVGDRVAQIMIIQRPPILFVEVPELSDSDRGTGGFGSTGLK